MRSARMRDRVKFKTNVSTADGSGGQTDSWVEVVTVWGDYKPMRGSEGVEGDKLQAIASGLLKVRHSAIMATVTEVDVVEIRGVEYQIRSIENVDREKRFLDIRVERGVNK